MYKNTKKVVKKFKRKKCCYYLNGCCLHVTDGCGDRCFAYLRWGIGVVGDRTCFCRGDGIDYLFCRGDDLAMLILGDEMDSCTFAYFQEIGIDGGIQPLLGTSCPVDLRRHGLGHQRSFALGQQAVITIDTDKEIGFFIGSGTLNEDFLPVFQTDIHLHALQITLGCRGIGREFGTGGNGLRPAAARLVAQIALVFLGIVTVHHAAALGTDLFGGRVPGHEVALGEIALGAHPFTGVVGELLAGLFALDFPPKSG